MGELGGRDPARRCAPRSPPTSSASRCAAQRGPGLGEAAAAVEDRDHRQLQALRPVHRVVPAEQRVGLVPDAEDDEDPGQIRVRDAAPRPHRLAADPPVVRDPVRGHRPQRLRRPVPRLGAGVRRAGVHGVAGEGEVAAVELLGHHQLTVQPGQIGLHPVVAGGAGGVRQVERARVLRPPQKSPSATWNTVRPSARHIRTTCCRSSNTPMIRQRSRISSSKISRLTIESAGSRRAAA